MATNQLPSSCLLFSPSEAQRLLLLCAMHQDACYLASSWMQPPGLHFFGQWGRTLFTGYSQVLPLYIFSSFLLFDPVTTMMLLTVDLRHSHFSDSLEPAFLSCGRSDSVEAVLLVTVSWFWSWTRTCCFSFSFFHRLCCSCVPQRGIAVALWVPGCSNLHGASPAHWTSVLR